MTQNLARIQIALGIVGMAMIAYGYVRLAPPMTRVLNSWAEVSAATSAELQLLQESTDQSARLAASYHNAIDSHIQTVQRMQHGLTHFEHSLASWQSQLHELAATSAKSGEVVGRFASLLPLKVPVLEYQTDTIKLDIPKFKLKEQNVELPYPTAKLGTRREKLDLGVTKIDVNLPTIDVGSAAKKVQLPAVPEMTTETTELRIPTNFEVKQQSLLSEEKELAQTISNDFGNLSRELSGAAKAIDETRQLVDSEIRNSLSSSERTLTDTAQVLSGWQQVQLPQWREQVATSQRSIDQAQPAFKELGGLVPWGFAVAFLIPIGMLINGAWMWQTSAGSKAVQPA